MPNQRPTKRNFHPLLIKGLPPWRKLLPISPVFQRNPSSRCKQTMGQANQPRRRSTTHWLAHQLENRELSGFHSLCCNDLVWKIRMLAYPGPQYTHKYPATESAQSFHQNLQISVRQSCGYKKITSFPEVCFHAQLVLRTFTLGRWESSKAVKWAMRNCLPCFVQVLRFLLRKSC